MPSAVISMFLLFLQMLPMGTGIDGQKLEIPLSHLTFTFLTLFSANGSDI